MSITSVLAAPIRWGREKAKAFAAKLRGIFRSYKVRVVTMPEKKVLDSELLSSRQMASKSVSDRNTQHSRDMPHRTHTRPKTHISHGDDSVVKAPAAKERRAPKPPKYRRHYIKIPSNIKDVKELKNAFAPGSPIFRSIIKMEYEEIRNLSESLLADFCDEVNADSYDDKVPLDVLFAKFMVDLEKLEDNLKRFKARKSIVPQKFAHKSHNLPESARAKALRVESLKTDDGIVDGALNWLENNQQVRVSLDERRDDILNQAGLQKEIAFGQKAKNIARLMYAASLAEDTEELVRFADVMESERLQPFTEDIMTEFRIRLFQNDVVSILNKNRASRKMIQAAENGEFGKLARLLKKDPSKLPPYVMHRLVDVIPGMAKAYRNHKHQDYQPAGQAEPSSAPAKPVKQPAEFTAKLAQKMQAIVYPPVSTDQIVQAMTVPDNADLGYDGVGAFTTMCTGLEKGDMYYVQAGMNYLIHDQHYPIVSPDVHQSVRYHYVKDQILQHLHETATSFDRPEIQKMLNDAAVALENDNWEALVAAENAFQGISGWPLFSDYQLEQMESCSRDVAHYKQAIIKPRKINFNRG